MPPRHAARRSEEHWALTPIRWTHSLTDVNGTQPAQKACESGCACLASSRVAMAYVGSDTSAITNRLPHHPHILLLFQWALGRHLTPSGSALALHDSDLPHTASKQVRLANHIGVPAQLHRGSSKEGVLLYASNGKHDYVRIKGASQARYVCSAAPSVYIPDNMGT
ncbi:hypothetical protein WJX77_011193 [Trebouxia sp. C0004]